MILFVVSNSFVGESVPMFGERGHGRATSSVGMQVSTARTAEAFEPPGGGEKKSDGSVDTHKP